MQTGVDRRPIDPGSRIGFVGLGVMGYPMAQRLLRAGFRVTAWNRTAECTRRLARDGADVAVTPADAARRATAVVTMLADEQALDAVSDGSDGLAAGFDRPGAVVIEMSTVGPPAVRRLASRMPAGVAVVDAPVLGSVAQATAGELDILVGADNTTFRRCSPLLGTLGRLVHVGGPGAGAAAKLVANSALLATVVALGESLALADALDLDRDTVYRVLDATPLAAQAQRRRPAIDSGAYPPRFRLTLARKDAQLIMTATAMHGVDARATAAALKWLADAENAGWGGADYTGVLGYILGQPTPE